LQSRKASLGKQPIGPLPGEAGRLAMEGFLGDNAPACHARPRERVERPLVSPRLETRELEERLSLPGEGRTVEGQVEWPLVALRGSYPCFQGQAGLAEGLHRIPEEVQGGTDGTGVATGGFLLGAEPGPNLGDVRLRPFDPPGPGFGDSRDIPGGVV